MGRVVLVPALVQHDDVVKWKHFPCYCPFVAAGNSPVTGDFPSQRPITRSFDVFFDLSKQLWGWWFEMQSYWLWSHCHDHCNDWLNRRHGNIGTNDALVYQYIYGSSLGAWGGHIFRVKHPNKFRFAQLMGSNNNIIDFCRLLFGVMVLGTTCTVSI